MIEWTNVQKQRLQELGASEEECTLAFSSAEERNRRYQLIEHDLVDRGREQLLKFCSRGGKPALVKLEERLSKALLNKGFSRVATPILLSKGHLVKMKITSDHPLNAQVYWVDDRKCLRPMLAPNLYFILKDLLRLWPCPVRIFEIGPCFRKDSQGGQHLQEFTMLNLVEMGLPAVERVSRLKELAGLVLTEAGIGEYSIKKEGSDIYGETVDLLAEGLELGSGAIGPHELDEQWGITVPWVGIGFGLERLIMVKEKYNSIHKAGRSLTYLDGVRLNI